MKTAVIYYSLEGNTRYVAEEIAAKTGADLISLVPVKEYPKKGLAKFYHGGKSAVLGETPELKPYVFDAEKYDNVILGCPVWASKCAAPINTFLAEHGEEMSEKGAEHVGIFLCQSGNGAQKVLEKYKETLKLDHFAGELVLIDPKKKVQNQLENTVKINEFCKKFL